MNGLTLKDVLHRVVHESHLTPAQIAEEIGTTYSMLCNAANPNLEDFKFAARHIIPVTKVTQDYRLLDFMEAACGRVAFSLPDLPKNLKGIQALVAEDVKEFGDVLQCIGEALEDGEISEIELKRLEVEVVQQVRKSMALLEAAKQVCGKGAA